MEPQWLTWAKKLRAIAQSGLTYTQSQYEMDRYEAVRQIAAEMLAAGSDQSIKAIAGLFDRETGYATPKVDVRGAAFRDDAVLLVKEAVDGKWTLPGGWADVGESPCRNVEREVQEESGFCVRAAKLAAVYDRNLHVDAPPTATAIYKLFFLCELIDGKATPSHETLDVGFFRQDELPELSAGRTTPGQLERMFAHYRDPSLPADYD